MPENESKEEENEEEDETLEDWKIVISAVEKARKTYYDNLKGIDGSYYPIHIKVREYNVEWECYGTRKYKVNDMPKETEEEK